jgi:hypothetical protein
MSQIAACSQEPFLSERIGYLIQSKNGVAIFGNDFDNIEGLCNNLKKNLPHGWIAYLKKKLNFDKL